LLWSKLTTFSVHLEHSARRTGQAVHTVFEETDLARKRFLDMNCSGLLSLAARQLGAEVHSFDYDPQSGAFTVELKCRFFPKDPRWQLTREPCKWR
jgi:hypothetical protein